MLKPGLYETVMTQTLRKELEANTELHSEIGDIDEAEAAKILSKYLTEIIEKKLDQVKDNGIKSQIALVNKITGLLMNNDMVEEETLVDEGALQLLGLIETKNSLHAINKKVRMIRPETSVSMSSLFTGAIHEPQLYSELNKEIASSTAIDLLVSFIKMNFYPCYGLTLSALILSTNPWAWGMPAPLIYTTPTPGIRFWWRWTLTSPGLSGKGLNIWGIKRRMCFLLP